MQKPNPLPKKIPAQPWFMRKRVLMPLFGAIMFASIFVEFQYIWNSVWRSYMYAMFGSLFICMALLVFVVCELSIIQCYFQLQCGNYEWQWRSFILGASGGIFVGLYSIYYMVCIAKMDMLAGELIYFVYAALGTYSLSVMCGMISWCASWHFVQGIYCQIRND